MQRSDDFHTFELPCLFVTHWFIDFFCCTILLTMLQRYFPMHWMYAWFENIFYLFFWLVFGTISSFWSLAWPALGATWQISIQQSSIAACLVWYSIHNPCTVSHKTSMHDSGTKKKKCIVGHRFRLSRVSGSSNENKCVTGNQANYF